MELFSSLFPTQMTNESHGEKPVKNKKKIILTVLGCNIKELTERPHNV